MLLVGVVAVANSERVAKKPIGKTPTCRAVVRVRDRAADLVRGSAALLVQRGNRHAMAPEIVAFGRRYRVSRSVCRKRILVCAGDCRPLIFALQDRGIRSARLLVRGGLG
jgi:hypothetical protein